MILKIKCRTISKILNCVCSGRPILVLGHYVKEKCANISLFMKIKCENVN